MQFKYAIPLTRSWLLQRSILTGRCVSHISRLQSRFVRLINSAISNAAPCQPHTLNVGTCRTFTFTLPISYSESQRWDISLLHLHTNLTLSTSGYVAPSTSHHQLILPMSGHLSFLVPGAFPRFPQFLYCRTTHWCDYVCFVSPFSVPDADGYGNFYEYCKPWGTDYRTM